MSVAENLDLYADLYGVTAEQRAERYPKLMDMTALGPFRQRLSGRLSGGMKQKLGLACTLVRTPELLLLDEPTVGVDPISRRELWEIVSHLVAGEGLSVLLTTAYLDEAERCGHVVLLHQGKVLAQGAPSAVTQNAAGLSYVAQPSRAGGARALQAQLLDRPDIIDAVPDGGRVRFVRASADQDAAATDALLQDAKVTSVPARFEDGFMVLLRKSVDREPVKAIEVDRPLDGEGRSVLVQVRDLVKRFGAFTAVDHVSFEVARGEIFGLLGPNGAGKTTTFRMLCGLLAPTGGDLHIAGTDVRRAAAAARSSASATSRRNSRSTASFRLPRTSNFSPAPTACAARANANASTGPCASSSSAATRRCKARSCPVDSSSGWPWRRRFCTSRRFCSWTSRPRAPTRWPGACSGDGSPRSPSRE